MHSRDEEDRWFLGVDFDANYVLQEETPWSLRDPIEEAMPRGVRYDPATFFEITLLAPMAPKGGLNPDHIINAIEEYEDVFGARQDPQEKHRVLNVLRLLRRARDIGLYRVDLVADPFDVDKADPAYDRMRIWFRVPPSWRSQLPSIMDILEYSKGYLWFAAHLSLAIPIY